MVFISFEGFLPDRKRSEQSTESRALGVVVTPGSPPKPVKSVSPIKIFEEHFVLFVVDKVTRDTFAVPKTHAQVAALHKEIRHCISQNPCVLFACCGPLRRVSKTNIPKRKSLFQFGFESSHISMDSHTTKRIWRVEEYVNDLLQSITSRDIECTSIEKAQQLIYEFLHISIHRDKNANDTLLSIKESLHHVVCIYDECSICLSHDQVLNHVKLECGHIFHQNCLQQWLCTKLTCPICRIIISPKHTNITIS